MIPFLSLKEITALYSEEIHEAVSRVIDSGWYLQGKETESFEENYAAYIGTNYCISCGNGLDALTLILKAYKELGYLHDGDEIIVPANTFIATILSITENHLKPILVEPKWNTLELDEDEVERHISKNTKAIVLVHLYGRLAYTEKIGEICLKHHLKLIEDNAQAQGCKYGEIRTGSIGDAAAHSFYPAKNIGALGDAGAITTNDGELSEIVRKLGNYGCRRKYEMEYLGRNSRMDEIQAAILNVKLKHLDEDNNHRKNIGEYYQKNIGNPLISMPERMEPESNVFHQFPIFSPQRNELQAFLLKNGIETAIHYPIPPHKQRCYKQFNHLTLPITEKIHREELSLPIHQAMTLDKAALITDCLNKFI